MDVLLEYSRIDPELEDNPCGAGRKSPIKASKTEI